MRPAIFLDRDGVIIENRERYVRSWADVALLPGALEALARTATEDVAFVIVTNQSAVGRGLMTLDEARWINDELCRKIARAGGRIDAASLCPHRPDDGCDCRKPRPGMLRRAAHDLGLDLARSWTIGDAASDLEAGRAAGTRTLLVRTGRGAAQAAAHGLDAVDDLAAALEIVSDGVGHERAQAS